MLHTLSMAADAVNEVDTVQNDIPASDIVAMLDRYADMVYRLAYARTGSHADAEDVLQEVFLRLLRVKPDFYGDEHRKAWLLRVTLQCAASFHRSAFRRHTVPLDADAVDLAAYDTAVSSTPLEVLDAVSRLPEQMRIMIHLFYYEDCTVAQIAALTDTAEATVKSRLHRARKLLRTSLKGEVFS